MTTGNGKWDGLRDASFRGVPFFWWIQKAPVAAGLFPVLTPA